MQQNLCVTMEQQQVKYQQEQAIIRLREMIVGITGTEPHTPKDFDYLSEYIYETQRQKLSATTLKRMWGYLTDNSSPRLATLNLLARFVGYADWYDYCQIEGFVVEKVAEDDKLDEEPIEEADTRPARRVLRVAAIVAIALAGWAVAAALLFHQYQLSARTSDAQHYVLHKGQVFANYGEYLQLFGIYDSTNWWGRVLPHHPDIVVWGPEYHHPHWLNDGDRQQLMPTITERWSSEQADSSWVSMRNADKFRHDKRLNEVRITFMKNLTDTGFVFLGVYRLSLSQSDTTRCVWERVADECDLANLDYLTELRN